MCGKECGERGEPKLRVSRQQVDSLKNSLVDREDEKGG